MKKKLYIILSCLLSFTGALAQSPVPPVYNIVSDTALSQSLSPAYVRVLGDKDGQFSIDGILSGGLNDSFLVIDQKASKSIGKTNWLWYKFRLKNKMSVDARFCVTTGAVQSDFYVVKNGTKAGHYVTGYSVPWSKKLGFKRVNAIPLVFKPGEEVTIYQKRYISDADTLAYGSNLRLTIFSTQLLTTSELKEYEAGSGYVKSEDVYSGSLTGIIFLAAILNFLLYIQTKDKSQLYFSLFLLFCFWGLSPIFLEMVFRQNFGFFRFSNQISDLAFIFFMLFLRKYFDEPRLYPRWDKFVLTITIVVYCAVVIGAIFPRLSQELGVAKVIPWSENLFLLTVFVTIIVCLRKPGEHRKVFIWAVSPIILSLLLFGIQTILIDVNLPPAFKPLSDFLQSNFLLYLFMSGIVWATLIFSSFLYKQYGRQEKKILEDEVEKERFIRVKEQERNELIAQQKVDLEKEVTERTAELNQSLNDLKATQTQLIQSEKMASLGELTAGIAHEIQNPLNFVNNFSEVSVELLAELKEEEEKGNKEDVMAIADDLTQNLEKIRHHGKRADAIVKGMLQHSQTGSAAKEPTNVNTLADEYLRLSYHGFRAKDKDFNADLVTHFDANLPKVNAIPQDIGRIMLNLFNNAFYAVHQKKKALDGEFKPVVTVTTITENGQVVIKVKDNGIGIPNGIKDKIMQPFFTTKPTGEGTGLGLSLTYDMVVKGHGGTIQVNSTEGGGSEFIIQLPVN